ncbi:protein MMS22-like [Cloeon dipterum]|uniref:protein MMS22-like n=1 Tax=Cloeon dipterum TaxID=197152 RepID=UPI00321F7CAA
MTDFDSEDDLFADDEAFQNAIEGDKKLQPYCFECQGRLTHAQLNQDLIYESVLRQGGMNLVFNNPNYHKGLIEKAGVDLVLFGGAKFDASSAILENLDELFQMARKLFIKNEKDAVKHLMHLNLNKGNYFDSRRKISLMFEYLTTYIQSLQTDEKFSWILEEGKSGLLENLELWFVLIQGLTKIEHNLLAVCPDSLGNKCRLPMHHLLHLHLELRWQYLCLLHALTSQKTEINRLMETALDHILCELIKLAEGVKQEDYELTRPFFCNCMREFWLMLQIFADKLHANNTISMPFWSLLRVIVNRIFSPSEENAELNVSKVTRPDLCSNWPQPKRYSFALWIFLNVCPLYGYSEGGIYTRRQRGQLSDDASNLLFLILKNVTADAKETDMRDLLRLLLQLPVWWNIGMQALNVLLDHFIKNINSCFMTPGENPSNLVVIAKSVSEFSEQIKRHQNLQSAGLDMLNSFCLFLKLLTSQMKNAWCDTDRPRFYNQIKSRICTKFAPGRILTLHEMGLYNMTALCLTVGLCMGLDEMSNKLQTFLAAAKADSQKKVILLSHMTLIHLKVEKHLSIEENIPPVTAMITSSCKNLNRNNPVLIDAVAAFVDSLNDVAEVLAKNEELAEPAYLFLGEWLPEYLSMCNATRSARVLTAMQEISSKLQFYEEIMFTVKKKEAVTSFIQYLIPFLKEESIKISPNSYNAVADIAFAVSAAADNTSFMELFRHFATNEAVYVGIATRYWSQVIASEEVLERVRTLEPKFNEIVLHEWIRCCVLDDSNGIDTDALTILICKLPDLMSLFGTLNLADLKKETYPLHKFGEMIAVQYDLRRESIVQRSEFKFRVQPYFKKLPALVSQVIQRDPNSKISTTKYPHSTIIRMYESIGNLFETCSPIMIKEKDVKCPLYLLANSLLLYEDISKFPTFAINPNIKAGLEAYLDKFLIGLGKVVKDGYVNRIFVASVKHFVHALDSKKDARGAHAIERAFRTNNPELVDKMAEIIGSQLLRMRGKFFENEHATNALHLLLNVLRHVTEESSVLSIVRRTLKETLLILMHIDDSKNSEKCLAFDYFKAIVNNPAFENSHDAKLLLYARLVELYKEKMAFQDVQLFQLLYVLAKYKIVLIKPTLRKLEEQLVLVEKRRQTTADEKLRSQLGKLMKILGPIDQDDFQYDD